MACSREATSCCIVRHKPGRVRRRGQAGRVLELVNERLEQKNTRDEPESRVWQNARLWRAGHEANQAFQPFETELDPPSQAIERQHILGRQVSGLSEVIRITQSGDEGLLGELVALSLSLPASFSSCAAPLLRLFDGDQSQGEGHAFAPDPDRADRSARAWSLAQLARRSNESPQHRANAHSPAGTDRDRPGVENTAMRSGFRYTRSAMRNLALDDRDAVQPRLLSGRSGSKRPKRSWEGRRRRECARTVLVWPPRRPSPPWSHRGCGSATSAGFGAA